MKYTYFLVNAVGLLCWLLPTKSLAQGTDRLYVSLGGNYRLNSTWDGAVMVALYDVATDSTITSDTIDFRWIATGKTACKFRQMPGVKWPTSAQEVVRVYHPDGQQVQSELRFRNGKNHGLWAYFDTTGAVNVRVAFDDGTLADSLVHYHPNGRIRKRFYFDDTLGIVRAEVFDANGMPLDYAQVRRDSGLGDNISDPEIGIRFQLTLFHGGVFIRRNAVPINMAELKSLVQYPQRAKDAGITGRVVLRVMIDEKGQYVRHIVSRNPHPWLTDVVTFHISKLKFQPAVGLDDLPFQMWVNVPFNFTLNAPDSRRRGRR